MSKVERMRLFKNLEMKRKHLTIKIFERLKGGLKSSTLNKKCLPV